MELFYSGEITELKSELSTILYHGRWKKLKRDYWQCRIVGGPILNFYPTTGRILVQGKEKDRGALMQELVDHAVEDEFHQMASNWIISN